jgi:DNA-binding beta-propeller fold protein YncE
MGLSQRGHVFSFAINGPEKPEELKNPSGVAVNEATGDVYVVDNSGQRIEQFGPEGTFIAAWGWGVTDGALEYQVCKEKCKPGEPGSGLAQFDLEAKRFAGIAVDNSNSPSKGDVYVVSNTIEPNNIVEKFGPEGESLGRLEFPEGPEGIGGIAVDASGTVWVYEHERGKIISFNSEAKNKATGVSIGVGVECDVPGFAVTAGAEAFYVNHQRGVFGETGEEECVEEKPLSEKFPGLIAKLNATGELVIKELDRENSSDVAVDLSTGQQPSGDVYVNNVTSIAAFDSSDTLIEHFGELSKGSGVAVNAQTNTIYAADEGTDQIDVFTPAPPAAPTVDAISSQNLSPTSTELKALIDPHGLKTKYFFQYGTENCAEKPSSCTSTATEELPEVFGAQPVHVTVEGLQPSTRYFFRVVAENELGEDSRLATLGTFTTLPNAGELLLDGRQWEQVSPPEKHGALILPIGGGSESPAPAAGVIQASEDGSVITYAANSPLTFTPPGNRAPEAAQVISSRSPSAWSSEDIITPYFKAEGIRAGIPQEYRFFSTDLSLGALQPGVKGNKLQEPPLVGPGPEERGIFVRHNTTCPPTCYERVVSPENDLTGAEFGDQLTFRGAAPNLQHLVFESDVALTPKITGVAPSAPGLYEWTAGAPASEQLQLVSVLPGNSKAAEGPALGDLLNSGETTVDRNAVSKEGDRVFWTTLQEVSGSTVQRLYMRDTVKHQTIQINAAQGVKAPKPEEAENLEEVNYRTASTDGSKVFFTDTYPLTESSQLTPALEGPADLYVCELSEGAEECKLEDLTVNRRSATESADVVGTLPGASDDGTYVYFVANGVLTEEAEGAGATHGNCARPSAQKAVSASAKCNLYVEHFNGSAWEEPRFIATLSQEDANDWGETGTQNLGRLSSRVSPNGHFLAFMSKEPLTGYNNVDASPAAKGARDEEVFLYEVLTGHVVCASCNPTGQPPHGVLDRESSSEGRGLLVDRFGLWKESKDEEEGRVERRVIAHWLAGSVPGWTPLSVNDARYQSRYLTDSGRLFFNSPDELVSHDTNGKEDVYEYEPSGVGQCQTAPGCVGLVSSGDSDHESAFLDASITGDDVFFLTNRQLLSSDQDTSFDVYDAHVCSVSPCIAPPPPPSPPCEALQTCKTGTAGPGAFQGPGGTSTFSGPGNGSRVETRGQETGKPKPKPLTRAQKLAKALKECRKKHKHSKKKRVACERRARAKYGPKHAHKHKKGKK